MLPTGRAFARWSGLLVAWLLVAPLAQAGEPAAAVISPCESGWTLGPVGELPWTSPRSVATASAGEEGCFARLFPLKLPLMPRPAQRPRPAPPQESGLLAALRTRLDRPETAANAGVTVPLRLSTVASLEAEREVIASLLTQVLNNLMPGVDGSASVPETLNFTLNLDHLRLNPRTLLQGRGAFNVGPDLNLLLESLTITVSNGTITSETELNPQDLSIQREEFQISLDIGNATVSSITTFEKNQGVTKQVLTMTAWLGQLQLHSQVTLALDSSEFLLGASISDLAVTTISTIDVSGRSSQTFELRLDF